MAFEALPQSDELTPPHIETLLEVVEDTKEEFLPSYDISLEEAKTLTAEFLASREQPIDSRFGCYVFDGNNPFSNLGRYIESTVFYGEFKNTPELMDEQYGPYEDVSSIFVVLDHENTQPVGALRIIEHADGIGLKSLNDLENSPLRISPELFYQAQDTSPEKCVDVATIAISEDYRGAKANHLPSLLLYRSLFLSVIDNPKFDHIINITDEAAEKNFKMLKFPFRSILNTDPFSYLDSKNSRALHAKTTEFYPQANYWHSLYKEEGEKNQDNKKLMIAAGLKMLKDGDYIDEMLAPEIAKKR
jgi:hypothetical protein